MESIQKNELLPKEVWEKASLYHPYVQQPFSTPESLAEKLLENAGRFRSPLSFREKIKLKLTVSNPQFDFFDLRKAFAFSDKKRVIPYNWQVLIEYLTREGVLAKPVSLVSFFLNDHIKMYSFRLKLSELVGKKRVHTGAGHSDDIETALSKTIGEVLERFFCLYQITDSGSRSFSLLELNESKEAFLSPVKLSHFSSEQKQKRGSFSYEKSDKFLWITGKEAITEKKVFLPLQSVFYGMWAQKKGEPLLREMNSNGAAGGFTFSEALLSGIYEAVERDGFFIFWLNNIAPPIIDVSTIDDEDFQKLLSQISRYKFEVKFLNITTDIGIPSCICVLIDRSGTEPSICLGGGCGFDIPKILTSSLREAINIYKGPMKKDEDFIKNLHTYIPFSDEKLDLKKRIELWQMPGLFHLFEPLLSGSVMTPEEAFSDLPRFQHADEELSYVKEIFRRFGDGYQIYYYEMKHRILRTLGYHVVKVIIPELVPIYLVETHAPLGASRLKTVPQKIGYSSAEKLNPWPHPFP